MSAKQTEATPERAPVAWASRPWMSGFDGRRTHSVARGPHATASPTPVAWASRPCMSGIRHRLAHRAANVLVMAPASFARLQRRRQWRNPAPVGSAGRPAGEKEKDREKEKELRERRLRRVESGTRVRGNGRNRGIVPLVEPHEVSFPRLAEGRGTASPWSIGRHDERGGASSRLPPSVDLASAGSRHARMALAAAGMVLFLTASSRAAAEPETPEILTRSRGADGIVKLTLPTSEAIERADLYFWTPAFEDAQPAALLVLAPGRNGNGRRLVARPEWQSFARRHRLVLCGLSFASDRTFEERSYSNAHSGSGALLLAGIEAMDPPGAGDSAADLPLLLYGFSAGARFTASFIEAHSERVVAWCGQAVGRWEDARETSAQPPGIVASGEWDAGCYHASLLYFQQGRKLGKPWTWLSLEETGHHRSAELDAYVRTFFAARLRRDSDGCGNRGRFYDIDTVEPLTDAEVADWPIFATWVPGGELEERWLELHHP